jgi:hypothetical protein
MLRRILNMSCDRTPENCVTVRYLYIVSREHRWLYRHLVERFQDDPDVEVILDRRVGERRTQPSGPAPEQERRRSERRRPISPDDDLRVRSHYIIEL